MTKSSPAIKSTVRVIMVSILVSALFWVFPARTVQANTYVVLNSNNSGAGSLRQAITDANNNPGPDLITFDGATDGVPIVLSGAAGEEANASGDLDILNGGDLTIQGNGEANTIIDGGGIDRIFHNCPGGGCTGTVTLSDMTLLNGSVTDGGGAINNAATLIIQDCTVGDTPANGSTARWGGGIFNAMGTMTIDGSKVENNDAVDGGGGIFNMPLGTLIIQNNSSIATNSATTDGGGIYNQFGTVTITDSTVSHNDAVDGGGIYNWDEGILNITNSTIGGSAPINANTASDDGGGIYNIGTATIDSSTISSNTSTDAGAGVYNFDTLIVQNGSTIGGAGAGNSAIEGGGINTQTGATTTVDASTVSVNSAGFGAGLFSHGTLHIQNGSTIGGTGAGNTATTYGGGVYVSDGTTTVNGSVVSANIADNGGGVYIGLTGELTVQSGSVIGGPAAGNLAVANGGGIYNKGQAWVNGSIVRDNTAGGDGGGIYDEGMLAVQNGSTIGGAGAGNTAVGDGGGIYNDALGTTVDASEVSANVASSDGGGIYNQAALTVQNGSSIGGVGVGNQAAYNGGGIFNDSTGTTTVTGSRILSNLSTNGGGLFNDRNGTSVVTITGSCIVGNSAASLQNNQSPVQSATGDWWGAPAGPNTPGADTTSGNWVVSGYLSAPILGCGYEIYLPLIMR